MSDPAGFHASRLAVSGEVDVATVPELLAEAHRLLEADPPRLEVDLKEVTFIDSSGLGALVQIQKAADDKGISVVLTRSSGPTRRLLELTGLQHVFTIAPPE